MSGRLVSPARADPQRHEVTGEVATVDGGDVRGRERRQRGGVIPVVKVAAIAGHPQQRVERRLEPREELRRRQVTEVACRQRRKQLQSDVGRRRPVRDSLAAILLKVVGNQPVVRRAGELVEESPGPARDAAQHRACVPIERDVAVPRRLTGRVGNGRREKPEREDEERERKPGRRCGADEDREPQRDRRRCEHVSQRAGRRRLHLRHALGRDPFEQPPPREQQPNERPPDRVEHHPALVQQEHRREERLPRAGDRGCRARRARVPAAVRRRRDSRATVRPGCRSETREP